MGQGVKRKEKGVIQGGPAKTGPFQGTYGRQKERQWEPGSKIVISRKKRGFLTSGIKVIQIIFIW